MRILICGFIAMTKRIPIVAAHALLHYVTVARHPGCIWINEHIESNSFTFNLLLQNACMVQSLKEFYHVVQLGHMVLIMNKHGPKMPQSPRSHPIVPCLYSVPFREFYLPGGYIFILYWKLKPPMVSDHVLVLAICWRCVGTARFVTPV